MDAQHAYRPADGDVQRDAAPHAGQGRRSSGGSTSCRTALVLGESDFQRNYHSVNKYYFASNGPTPGPARGTAACRRPGLRAQAGRPDDADRSRRCWTGPTSWLNPVVEVELPHRYGAEEGRHALAPDDQNS